MATGGRFGRVARDLEKLPCELIELVLVDLELVQIIRIYQYGGPRVIWSIENSPAWGDYFRNGRGESLRTLLDITDQIEAPFSSHFNLKFLRKFTLGDTRRIPGSSCAGLTSLPTTWLCELWWLLGSTALTARTESNDFKLFRPHLPTSTDAQAFEDLASSLASRYHDTRFSTPPSVSVQDLQRFATLYERACRGRAAALAAELHRLADLYAAHPTRVKEPRAPQTRRPNAAHVPTEFRRGAARLLLVETKETTFPWREPCRSKLMWPFPPLVPYDWCLWLFVQVVERHGIPTDDDGDHDGRWRAHHPPPPPGVADKVMRVLVGLSWVYDWHGEPSDGAARRPRWPRTVGMPWSAPPGPDGRAGFLVDVPRVRYFPHAEVEIEWLEAFVEVVAWMEGEFPEIVREVRGPEWEDGNSEERRQRGELRENRRIPRRSRRRMQRWTKT